jgi:hypothetical protein
MTALPVAEETDATKPTTAKNEPTAVLMTQSGAYVGLNEAKRLTGKSKDTILRHAEKGTISWMLNDQKRKVYQVVDLERVFGFTTTPTSRDEGASNQNDQHDQEEPTAVELAVLREKLRHAEEMTRVYQDQAQRAEREAEDWKQQAAQAMRMLTYQPQPVENDQNDQPQPAPKLEPEPMPQPKKRFLGIFGGR